MDENILYYVPKHKFLGGYFMPYIALNYATGSLVADIPDIPGANLSAGGSGFRRHVCPASESGLAPEAS